MSEADAWCVATTARHAERSAEVALTARGYTCWCPLYTKRFRGYRFDGEAIRRRSRTDSFGPRVLFPGYCFVLVPWSSDARDIDTTRGVRELMRHPPADEYSLGEPKRIQARIIQQLRDVCDMGLWEDPNGTLRAGNPERILPGVTVRTTTGIVGRVLRLDDRGRADLLADLLGQQRTIRSVDGATLEAVEP